MTHDYRRRLVETTGNRQPTPHDGRDGKVESRNDACSIFALKISSKSARRVHVESILSDVPCIAITVCVTADPDLQLLAE
jgi:hypothetical protein